MLDSNFISQNLNLLMSNQSLSANDLSKLTGIPAITIHKLKVGENINPTIQTLIPIARYFSVSLDDLVNKPINLSTKTIISSPNLLPVVRINEIEQFPNCNVIRYICADIPKERDVFCVELDQDQGYFKIGTILVIDKEVTQSSNKIVIVRSYHTNTYSLKKIVFDDEFFLVSLVPGLEYKFFSIKDYLILGVVVSSVNYY